MTETVYTIEYATASIDLFQPLPKMYDWQPELENIF